MTAHPDHHASTSALGNICAQAIANIEKCLAGQQEADAAAAKKREEKSRVGQERLAAEQAKREKLEREKKLAEERSAIAAAEKELALKKKLLEDAVNASATGEEMDEDNGIASCSTIEQPEVSLQFTFPYIIYKQNHSRSQSKSQNGSRSWRQGRNSLRSYMHT